MGEEGKEDARPKMVLCVDANEGKAEMLQADSCHDAANNGLIKIHFWACRHNLNK